MKIQITVVPISSSWSNNVGILVTDLATQQPVEPIIVVPLSLIVKARNEVIDRYCSMLEVIAVAADPIPSWAKLRIRQGVQ
jgi:hypothetical protein